MFPQVANETPVSLCFTGRILHIAQALCAEAGEANLVLEEVNKRLFGLAAEAQVASPQSTPQSLEEQICQLLAGILDKVREVRCAAVVLNERL